MNLERELVALGRALAVPAEPPSLAAGVMGQLDRELRAPARTTRRRLGLALAFAVLAAVAATLAIPDARSALLRVLDLGGERVVRVDELPAVPAAPAGLDLPLGTEVTLAEARARAGFRIRLPADAASPDRVYLGERGTVWLLWGTPQRARLLVAQSQALEVGSPPLLEKLVSHGTSVEPVSVAGERGWFLSGEPHVVYLLDEQGDVVEEVAWLARNVLVWGSAGVTFRMEGDFDRDAALALARSLR